MRFHPLAAPWPLIEGAAFSELVKSLRRCGFDKRHPIILYEEKILDGRNRWRACKEAGIDPIFQTFKGTPKQALEYAILSNQRRNLDESQRAMVAAKLVNLPRGGDRKSDNFKGSIDLLISIEQAAEMQSVGTGSVKKAALVLKSGNERLIRSVEQGECAVSAAAKMIAEEEDIDAVMDVAERIDRTPARPVAQKHVLEEEEEEEEDENGTAEEEEEVVSRPDPIRRKKLDIKAARATVKRKEIEAEAEKAKARSNRYKLFNKKFESLLKGDGQLFDWIVTDPPYPKDFLHLYDDLADVSSHVLKDGGSLLCMTGQSYLPDVIAALAEKLNYNWTLAYLTPGGQAVQIFPRKVNTFWKPILWFVKGKFSGKDWIGDVTRSDVNDNDKRFHGWGQSESGMLDLMKRFVRPGQSVLDPFMGAGTTGLVALELGATFVGYDSDKAAFDASCVRFNRYESGN